MEFPPNCCVASEEFRTSANNAAVGPRASSCRANHRPRCRRSAPWGEEWLGAWACDWSAVSSFTINQRAALPVIISSVSGNHAPYRTESGVVMWAADVLRGDRSFVFNPARSHRGAAGVSSSRGEMECVCEWEREGEIESSTKSSSAERWTLRTRGEGKRRRPRHARQGKDSTYIALLCFDVLWCAVLRYALPWCVVVCGAVLCLIVLTLYLLCICFWPPWSRLCDRVRV